MPGGKTRKITGAERAELTMRALEMLKAGSTYRKIADNLGIAAPTVHKYIKSALQELAAQQAEITKEFQVLQLQRYNAILEPAYEMAIEGDPMAGERARRILDSMSTLMGANAPTKVAPTDPTGNRQYDPEKLTPEERQARIAELEQKLKK